MNQYYPYYQFSGCPNCNRCPTCGQPQQYQPYYQYIPCYTPDYTTSSGLQAYQNTNQPQNIQ